MSTDSIVIADKDGNAKTLAVELNAGVISPHAVPEVAGVPVSASNPMPVKLMGQTPVSQTGSFTTVTSGASISVFGDFNVWIWGTFTGTIRSERSFDGGTTWFPYTAVDGTVRSWTAAVNTTLTEPELGIKWRLNVSSGSITGTANWRISQ